MIGTENLWKNLITQIFPYDFIEANCARTLRREDDATRRDETRETERETKC
jgi:hypothetical protein